MMSPRKKCDINIHVLSCNTVLMYFVYLLHCTSLFRTSRTAMTKRITSAKIALLDFSLQKAKMKMGVQVLIENPEQLDGVRQRCVIGLVLGNC